MNRFKINRKLKFNKSKYVMALKNDEIELYAGISIIYNIKMERSLVGRDRSKGRTAFHCSVSRVATLLCLCMRHLRPICVLNFTIVLSLSKTTNHIRIPSKGPFFNSDLTSLPIMYIIITYIIHKKILAWLF